MSVDSVSGGVPARSSRRRRHGRLASRAVGLSVVSIAAFAASVATIGIVYGAGRGSAIEDNWLAWLLAAVASSGLLGSFVAFVVAIVARVRRERWMLLWLPLLAFPACLLFLALGEAFWWE